MEGKTVVLGFELFVGFTIPFNSDFDGDENNIWDLQALRTGANTQKIADVGELILSTENNKPAMGSIT